MRIIDISFENLSFYWDIILDTCGISLCEKLQKLLNWAACILLCINSEKDIDEMLAKPQRLVPNSVMMNKTWHGLIPEYVQSWFVSRNDLTLYQLGNSGFSITPHQLLRCFAIEQLFSWTLIKSFYFSKFKCKLHYYSFEWDTVF